MGVVMGGDPGEVDVRWTRPAVTGFEDAGRGLKTRGVSSLLNLEITRKQTLRQSL